LISAEAPLRLYLKSLERYSDPLAVFTGFTSKGRGREKKSQKGGKREAAFP